jgi:putative CocE/NonD family hydrolase
MGSLIGDVDFGTQAKAQSIDLMGIQLRWFDHWLKGIDSDISREPVRIFVMGENQWDYLQEFPLPNTSDQTFYLHSRGKANTLKGNGWLDNEPAVDEEEDHFTYDPLKPLLTRGGGLCCSDIFLPGGAFDQQESEQRTDVLVYTSAPLKTPLRVVGAVSVRLFASTNVHDTDFTAKLSDVHADDSAINISDGITRLRFRNGAYYEELAETGRVYEVKISLGYTAQVFKPGHRIRLDISSSNFPRFNRNLNTGTRFDEERYATPADQIIHHDRKYRSAMILSVVNKDLT